MTLNLLESLMAGRPLRRMRNNPLNTEAAAAAGIRLTRSKPPGWLALGVRSGPGLDETLAKWFADSPPSGLSVLKSTYPDGDMEKNPIEYAWHPNSDVTEEVKAAIVGIYGRTTSSNYSREQSGFHTDLSYQNRNLYDNQRKYFSFRVTFDISAVKATYKYLGSAGWSLSRFVNVMKENASPDTQFEMARDRDADTFTATVNLPRRSVMTPGAWAGSQDNSRFVPDAEEAQILTDQMNALLKDFYDLVNGEIVAAERGKAGEVRESRYSVVLTYKGIVLEAIPVETQQDAIDAMTAMQGELRIKTVKGGSSKGAKANPRNRYSGYR